MEDSAGGVPFVLGCLQSATRALLDADDLSGKSLSWAIECVALQSLLDDRGVLPELVMDGVGTPRNLLEQAIGQCELIQGELPEGFWSRLSRLRLEVG